MRGWHFACALLSRFGKVRSESTVVAHWTLRTLASLNAGATVICPLAAETLANLNAGATVIIPLGPVTLASLMRAIQGPQRAQHRNLTHKVLSASLSRRPAANAGNSGCFD